MSTTTPTVAAYSPVAFCKAYNIGRTKLYDLFASGELIARKMGTRTLILREDAERWAASLPVLGGEGA